MYLDVSQDSDKYDALIKFYGLMTIASSIIFVKVCNRDDPFDRLACNR